MQRPAFLTKCVSLAVCASLFATQCLAGVTPDVWAERRRTAQLAGLPSMFEPAPGRLSAIKSPSESATNAIRALSPGLRDRVAPLVENLPAEFVTVKAVRVPAANAASRVVIHVNDIHRNLEAQKNIAAAVAELSDRGSVPLVALEGSFDAIDVSSYRHFRDQAAIGKVASYLLKENKISGPVEAAMTGASAAVIGVDDPAHYRANVAAYRRSAAVAVAERAAVARALSDNAAEAAQIFPPALLDFHRQVEAYRAGRLPLPAYVSLLRATAASTPDVDAFAEALALEKRMDFAAVETQRAQLIKDLSTHLKPAQMSALLERSVAFRLGRLSPAAFYDELSALSKAAGVNLDRYPVMKGYIRYTLLSGAVNADTLLAELARMEDRAYAMLARTADDRRVVAEANRLHLTERLINFSLNAGEWARYKQTPPDERDGLAAFRAFYAEAETRDARMAANLLAAMDRRHAATAVIVAGGFHSEGLAERLAAQGVVVVSVTPKITRADAADGSEYLTAFLQQKTPLEKLISGDKLFLAGNPADVSLAPVLAAALSHVEGAQQTIRELDARSPLEAAVTAESPGRQTEMAISNGASRQTGRALIRYNADEILDAAWEPADQSFRAIAADAGRELVRRFALPSIAAPLLVTAALQSAGIGPLALVAAPAVSVVLFLALLPRVLNAHARTTAEERAWLGFALPALAVATAVAGAAAFLVLAPAGLPVAVGGSALIAALTNLGLHIPHNLPSVLATARAWADRIGARFVPAAARETLVRRVLRAPTPDRPTWEAVHLRAPPTAVATGRLANESAAASGNIIVDGPAAAKVEAAAALHTAGFRLLGQFSSLPAVAPAWGRANGIPVSFAGSTDGFINVEDHGLSIDIDLPTRLGLTGDDGALASHGIDVVVDGQTIALTPDVVRLGLTALSALNLLYAIDRSLGMSEKISMENVLSLYETLRDRSPDAVGALHSVLDTPLIDSDNLFSMFLRKAAGPITEAQSTGGAEEAAAARAKAAAWYQKVYTAVNGTAAERLPDFLPGTGDHEEDAGERRRAWEERWVAWFLSARDMDAPVDMERADDILSSNASKDLQAQRLLDEVDAPRAYDARNERGNTERKRRDTQEKGQSLTVSRFGRASYFLTMLASASRFVVGLQGVESAVGDLQGTLGALDSVAARIPGAAATDARQQARRLQGAVTQLRLLAQPDQRPTQAQLRGAVQALAKAARSFQASAFERLDGSADGTKPELRRIVSDAVQRILQRADDLNAGIDSMPGENANFSVLIQRASNTGVRALNHLRLTGDPFEGGEEHISQVRREGGAMAYASSDDAWFEVADYWVEALPLFIHEEKVVYEDGRLVTKIVIEQDAMETALRRLAIRWKKNIDAVMESEHVALARVYLVQYLPALRTQAEALLRATPSLSLEEAARLVCEQALQTGPAAGRARFAQILAGTSALVQATWRSLAPDVSRLQQEPRVSRMDALARVIQDSNSPNNFVRNAFLAAGSDYGLLQNALTNAVTTADAGAIPSSTARVSNDLATFNHVDLLLSRRREIPTWIILTTQASGMSDAFAGHWVDEEMSLYNLTTGFTHDGVTLEDEARALAKRHEARLLTITRRLVHEFQLDHLVGEMVATGQARDENAALLTLLRGYTDLAREVAKVYMLYELQQTVESPVPDEAYAVEPPAVEARLADHRDRLQARAVEMVIEQNAELHARVAANEISAADVMTTPALSEVYGAEVQKVTRMLARDEAIHHLAPAPTDAEVQAQLDANRERITKMARTSIMMESAIVRGEMERGTWTSAAEDHLFADGQMQVELLRRELEIAEGLAQAASEKKSESVRRMAEWYVGGDTPRVLRLRLLSDKGMTTARQETLSRYWLNEDGSIVPANLRAADSQGHPLFLEMNNPVYAYAAKGANKKYNRGYGPSRVDLGNWERYTTETLTQWIGPADQTAKLAMKRFYELYNFNVRAFDEARQGEEMKPLENALMESSLAVTHLFIPMFQAIGSGNLLKLFYETNQRREVFARAGGAGSTGFCQPKDIYFLPFVTTTAVDEIMQYAGVPVNNWDTVLDIRRHVLSAVAASGAGPEAMAEVTRLLDEGRAEARGRVGGGSTLLGGPTTLPPMSSMEAFGRIGMGDPLSNPLRAVNTLIASYHADVIASMEGRMRFAPINLIHLLQSAFDHLHAESGGRTPTWEQAVITMPVEYKPVSDARLSMGLRVLEFLSGLGDHLMLPMGAEGEALAHFVLNGFDENDAAMKDLVAHHIFKKSALTADDVAHLKTIYPHRQGPADVRMISPFNLAAEAIYTYVSGTTLRPAAIAARRALNDLGLKDDVITANALTYGADVASWKGVSARTAKTINDTLGARIQALVFSARLDDPEYRARAGSDLWDGIRGADVFTMMVHYPEMTGSEDEGDELAGFGRHDRMIDDLARVRDTMTDRRPNSALIWFDAPVQGRKTAADLIGIKQWLALGGWYVSPTMSEREVENLRDQVNEEIALMEALTAALKRKDFDEAKRLFASFHELARRHRYDQAHNEEEFAKDASHWWRGGGFNNWSVRHRYYAEAWARAAGARSLNDLDLGSLMVLGDMYRLNGRTEEEIQAELSDLREGLHDYSLWEGQPATAGFNDHETAEIIYLFVKPHHEPELAPQALVKGESSSLKRADGDAERSAGRALANYKARKAAVAVAERVDGFHAAATDGAAASVTDFVGAAYHALGDGRATISNQDFGRFLFNLDACLSRLIDETLPPGAERDAMKQRAAAIVDGGRKPSADAWATFMGRGDDKGDVGRLALAADGDKDKLKRVAQVAGLLDVAYALMTTLEYQQIPETEVDRIGAATVSKEVCEAVAGFFSKTIYDHTFDYFPTWMQPTKSGAGFTNYDNIMGRWLGHGAPFTREEVMALAVDTHAWLDGYWDNLFRTKTWMRQAWAGEPDRQNRIDLLLGSAERGVLPVGGGAASFSATENAWWTYTQKRELAFFNQQGHQLAAVFDDFDAEEFLAAGDRPTLHVTSPIGRPHLTVFLKENPGYNEEYQEPANVVLGRSYDFKDVLFQEPDGDLATRNVMTVPSGVMYLDEGTFVRARTRQLARTMAADAAEVQARAEAQASLKKHLKGIPVAVRFHDPLVNHFSMPFHGTPYYQAGEDEALGLPTSQAWIHNLTPGYSKGEEHRIYAGTDIYPKEERWYRRWQYDEQGRPLSAGAVVKRILDGFSTFPGLRHITGMWRIISKPFRQSGGRGALPQQIRDTSGGLIDDYVEAFAKNLAEQGYVDDQVVQRLISSTPYVWASPQMIDLIRAGLIKKGIALPQGAPLFVYSRIISIWVDGKMEHVVELVVSSRMAVSNVGLGGVLYKWRKQYGSTAELADKIMGERRSTATRSMERIEQRSREVWGQIAAGSAEIADQEPDFPKMRERLARAHGSDSGEPRDLTGWPYARPRYIMHDMLDVPVVRLESGQELAGPDILDVHYAPDGKLESLVVIDNTAGAWKPTRVAAGQIVGWKAVKIEDNIGYGLWQPYDQDEQRIERENAAAETRPLNPANWGGELRRIMRSFLQAADGYRQALGGRPVPTNGSPADGASAPTLAGPANHAAPTATTADDAQRAIAEARRKLGKAAGSPLTSDELSVAIKEFAGAAGLGGDIHNFIHGAAGDAVVGALAGASGLTPAGVRAIVSPAYADRVAEMVRDQEFTHTAAPELVIAVAVAPHSQVAAIGRGASNHFLVVDDYAGVRDEAYALIVDAQTGPHSGAVPNFLIVRSREIRDDGGVTEAIVFDPAAHRFQLMTFDGPVYPNRVQVLALSDLEVDTHRRLSAIYAAAGIPQVNADLDGDGQAPSAAAIADSKAATTAKLEYLTNVPRALLLPANEHATAEAAVRRFVETLMAETGRDEVTVRVQPDQGTEGEGQSVHGLRRADLAGEGLNGLMGAVRRLQSVAQNVVVREDVGNAFFGPDHRRVSLRLNVSHAYPGLYSADSGYAQIGGEGSVTSSVRDGGRIVTMGELLPGIGHDHNERGWLSEDDFARIKAAAVNAVEGLNLGQPPQRQLYWAGVDIVLEFAPDGKFAKAWVVDVNPRPTGLRHAERVDSLFNDSGAFAHHVPFSAHLWAPAPASADVPDLVMQLVAKESMTSNMDESHIQLFSLAASADVLVAAANRLTDYLALDADAVDDNLLLLKQERAVLILADALWILRDRLSLFGDIDRIVNAVSTSPATREKIKRVLTDASVHQAGNGYLQFINQFMAAANERELKDFERALGEVRRALPQRSPGNLRFDEPNQVHISESGMRLGQTSGNASDNWTNTKLRGSAVLNTAIDLDNSVAVRVEVERIPDQTVILESEDGLEPAGLKRAVFDLSGAAKTIHMPDGDHAEARWTSLADVSDPKDPLRMLKHALAFTGIAPNGDLAALSSFTQGGGLRIRIVNTGISRSGFASSSAVAVNLLNALFRASGQTEVVENPVLLGSLALLFENQLGLKSGRQDVDGPVFPGVKHLTYPRTSGIVQPEVPIESVGVDPAELTRHLVLIDSGVRRPAATDLSRGLNMRHLAFLSRNPQTFLAIRKSFGIHWQIVEGFRARNWPLLGRLFLDYMGFRETIDPGATGNDRVLRLQLFDRLTNEGLIHGGMFTGAMGGGVAMFLPTDAGMAPADGGAGTVLERRLEEIRGEGPLFANLKPIVYGVNTEGIRYRTEPKVGAPHAAASLRGLRPGTEETIFRAGPWAAAAAAVLLALALTAGTSPDAVSLFIAGASTFAAVGVLALIVNVPVFANLHPRLNEREYTPAQFQALLTASVRFTGRFLMIFAPLQAGVVIAAGALMLHAGPWLVFAIALATVPAVAALAARASARLHADFNAGTPEARLAKEVAAALVHGADAAVVAETLATETAGERDLRLRSVDGGLARDRARGIMRGVDSRHFDMRLFEILLERELADRVKPGTLSPRAAREAGLRLLASDAAGVDLKQAARELPDNTRVLVPVAPTMPDVEFDAIVASTLNEQLRTPGRPAPVFFVPEGARAQTLRAAVARRGLGNLIDIETDVDGILVADGEGMTRFVLKGAHERLARMGTFKSSKAFAIFLGHGVELDSTGLDPYSPLRQAVFLLINEALKAVSLEFVPASTIGATAALIARQA